MGMSMQSRREYLATMVRRYRQASSRREKTQLIEEVVNVLGYNRKYAIQVLNGPPPAAKPPLAKRRRPLKYLEALPIIQVVWEALDYRCAERLHPCFCLPPNCWPPTGNLF